MLVVSGFCISVLICVFLVPLNHYLTPVYRIVLWLTLALAYGKFKKSL